jgi:hypothetical protein
MKLAAANLGPRAAHSRASSAQAPEQLHSAISEHPGRFLHHRQGEAALGALQRQHAKRPYHVFAWLLGFLRSLAPRHWWRGLHLRVRGLKLFTHVAGQ